jgi:hypothetical protein
MFRRREDVTPTWELPRKKQIRIFLASPFIALGWGWAGTVGESTGTRITTSIVGFVGGIALYLVAWWILKPNRMTAEERKELSERIGLPPNDAAHRG